MTVDSESPRVLVVEDEPLLRRQLCDSLRALWPELRQIDEAESGAAAVRLIGATPPDIAFLDINLPDMSGIDLAPLLRERCQIVFVTAYSEFALTAFEQHAIDYVLKPATSGRLADTVMRLRQRFALEQAARRPLSEQAVNDLARLGRRTPLQWLSANSGNVTRLIPIGDVLGFTADEKYTEVITCAGSALIRKPIRELLDELSPDEFWQIHRATVVRVAAIDKVIRTDGGLEVVLRDVARRFPVSRSYAHLFRQL